MSEDAAQRGLFDLAGKVAVVTGSSRGIGRAIAARMAEAGAAVFLASAAARFMTGQTVIVDGGSTIARF